MAEKDFDFGAFKELKLTKYEKEYCKTAVVKKSSAALIFLDYKMAGKKTPCVVIPFKKYPEAFKAFKAAKLAKEAASAKKLGLAEISIGKGADGKEEITVDIKKGGISPEALMAKGANFFATSIGMTLKAIGAADEATDIPDDKDEEEGNNKSEETSKTTTSETASKPNNNEVDNTKKEAKKADRAEKLALMQQNVDKMGKAVGSVPNEKLEANVEKYEAALAQLIKAAQADGVIDKDEQKQIDELTNALKDLKNAMTGQGDTPKGKPLTAEQKAKIKENMTKINARLEAIVKKLGL